MSTEERQWRPTVVLVGGFLGAGKTTLILKAARMLKERGIRSAVVMNDQGDELVDTALSSEHGLAAGEVTGGCFCCRFSALLAAMDGLRAWRPEVIFAEPVGSCTDIAATVLAPLWEEYARYRVAPFSVLVDPARAAGMKSADADAQMRFLFEEQLKEADLICMTKSDLYAEMDKAAWSDGEGRPVLSVSGKTGAGIGAWLDRVLLEERSEERRFLDIDYEQYARAEAALAWLNLRMRFVPQRPMLPSVVAGKLLDGVDEAVTKAGVRLVHLKLMNRTATGWVKAAQCANGEEPAVEGMLDASPAEEHEVLLNLRAVGEPGEVERLVREQVERMEGCAEELRLDCFSPSAPVPERRAVKARTALP